MFRRLKRTILYISLLLKKNASSPEKSIYIELPEVSTGAMRRLTHIYSLFKENGYYCNVYIPFLTFINTKKFIHITRDKQFNLVCKSFKKEARYVASDQKEASANNLIKVNYNIFTDKVDPVRDIFYPIGFHPDLMSKENENFARSLSGKHDRKIAAFFAGNVLERKYTNQRTKEYFNINTRYEIIKAIQDNLSSDYVYFPGSYEDLLEKMESGYLRNKVVIMDTQKAGIPQHQWLRLLSESDYFIYTPGILYPWCHNQIESMAAGAIPITQFPHIFHPELQEKENCFTWQTTRELVDILKEIAAGKINANHTSTLRMNINAYYETHYSFESFGKRIERLLNEDARDSIQLYICAGEHSMI
ncbi:hypothetical protein [Marispirochaeta aestuarii]|uniref:hypothetical protein n=1 Tax=Marispirochaeta aestuarii TaxID=1963862 RepID=UPI002ABE640A|nr:hypothetical protein [Marispirochaeta aestuarii]